jgi:hypothetical protein
MTCIDCIKYDACLTYNGGMTRTMSMKNKAEQECGHFANKANYTEMKHAYWYHDKELNTTYCSNCKNEPRVEFDLQMHAYHCLTKFCDGCGAIMDLNKKEDEQK